MMVLNSRCIFYSKYIHGKYEVSPKSLDIENIFAFASWEQQLYLPRTSHYIYVHVYMLARRFQFCNILRLDDNY